MAKTNEANILSLIEADHRKLDDLIAEAEKGESKKLYSLFNQIYTELNLHARGEELSLYPAMREHKETAKFVEEAESEHEEAEALAERMKNMGPDAPAFKELLGEFKAAIQHHVQEEENEIFAAVRKCMDEQQLVQLGQEFQQAKLKFQDEVKEALTR